MFPPSSVCWFIKNYWTDFNETWKDGKWTKKETHSTVSNASNGEAVQIWFNIRPEWSNPESVRHTFWGSGFSQLWGPHLKASLADELSTCDLSGWMLTPGLNSWHICSSPCCLGFWSAQSPSQTIYRRKLNYPLRKRINEASHTSTGNKNWH